MMEAALNAEHLGEVIEERTVELGFGRCAKVGNIVGDLDIAHGRKRRQEVEPLEDKANLCAPHLRAFRIGELGEVDAVDQHRSSGGSGEAAEDVEEGRFSRTGG